MKQPKILILGANGQVGRQLYRCLSPLGQIIAATRNGELGLRLDLLDLKRVLSVLDELKPDFIVNAAAYTAVDQAEEEPGLAHRLNAGLPSLLAEWTCQRRVPVIHFSTDYVFDGDKQGAYTEEDTPNPINVYGRSKMAGDIVLLENARAPFIFRVSWIYAVRGNNFLLTMKQLMQERFVLRVVDDQWGAPTWS